MRCLVRTSWRVFALGALLPLFDGAQVSRPPLASAAGRCTRLSDSDTMRPAYGAELMVVSAHPLASQAGCAALTAGGTAADAAVAVQMVLAVVEPQSSGLAGGSVMTYYDAAQQRVRFYDGLAVASAEVSAGLGVATADEAIGLGDFGRVTLSPGHAVGVPGTVAVLSQLHAEHGQLAWSSLFQPAVRLAVAGFPMSPYLHDILTAEAGGVKRCAYPDLAARYCRDGKPRPLGSRLYNRELAQVLREVRDGGAQAFYDPRGPIARAIVARVRREPQNSQADRDGAAVVSGLLTVEDFARYVVREREPLCAGFAGRRVCTAPPPSFGGLTVLQTLGFLDRSATREQAPRSAGRIHMAIEASRLAQVDRRRYVGDPDFGLQPVEMLLDPSYLDERFAMLSPDRALALSAARLPDGVEDTTSSISIVDGLGNALSMTTTVNASFGAHMEARGMVLNNVQHNFTHPGSLSAGLRVNGIEARKRPRTSMAPTLVFDTDEQLELVVGAAGGSHIPDYVSQAIIGMIYDDLDPQAAVSEAHWSGQALERGCSGRGAIPASDVELSSLATGWLHQLRALGHPCPRAVELRSGLTVVQLDPSGGLWGAADPRRDGIAVGR